MRVLCTVVLLVAGCKDDVRPTANVAVAGAAAPELVRSEEGVVGATCYARPTCAECKSLSTNDPAPGTNVCKQFEEFYPGITMALAKSHAIKKCQELNALDECGNHCKDGTKVREKNGGGCYAQCATKTSCIYFDNR